MFGLWFSIIGLVFGVICSVKAREKKRVGQDWFLLGFIFSVITFAILHFLPDENRKPAEMKYSNEGNDANLYVTN